jgi:hypothetical protein
MHHKIYILGIALSILAVLCIAHPHPAVAQSPHEAPVTRAGSNPSNLSARSFLLSDVWALTVKHQRRYNSHFSTELITCLMWEESGFRLVQNPTSKATGFGQIMPSTLKAVNKRFGTKLTPADLLNSPDSSIKATVLTLELMWQAKKNKVDALMSYAGGPRNYRYVRKWLNAEPEMLKARNESIASADVSKSHSKQELLDAMHLCSQPGFDPRVISD